MMTAGQVPEGRDAVGKLDGKVAIISDGARG